MKYITILAYSALLAGCATPKVVDVRQAGDDNLNCMQLTDAYQDAQDFEAKARKERGVTGTNVAAAVFFWPALVGTYANSDEAITAAQERQRRLERLADAKGCRI